jgi:Protein of unknown function (DUF3500)
MFDAARTFLADLNPAQKSKAVLPFNSEERFRWFYTPVSRKGIPLKELSVSQKLAGAGIIAHGLEREGLHEGGDDPQHIRFFKVTAWYRCSILWMKGSTDRLRLLRSFRREAA